MKSSAELLLESIPPSVQVIAVSKLQPIDKIRLLHSIGPLRFGENYVQELKQKVFELKGLNIEWHFIGHLQTNKVKDIVGAATWIHSIDRIELAQRLEQRLKSENQFMNGLIQVNIAGEATKSGVKVENLESLLEFTSGLHHLKIQGLMTMPPLESQPEENRPHFRSLRQLSQKFSTNEQPLHHLSMGTSHDFRIAVDEGATMIRLGSVLFGERLKKV